MNSIQTHKPASTDRLSRSFSRCNTPPTREALELAVRNWSALDSGLTISADPQHPRVVAMTCSAVSLARVQNIREAAVAFQFKGRGIMGGDAAWGTLGYAFRHLFPKATLLEGVAHTCDHAKRECRGTKQHSHSAHGLPVLPSAHVAINDGIPGCARHGLPIPEAVPFSDARHVQAQVHSIISRSPDIAASIARGELIATEGYFNKSTGRVHWLGIIQSENRDLQVRDENVMGRLLAGDFSPEELKDLRPGMQELHALIVGNNTFVENYSGVHPTRTVVYSCADSRVSSLLFDAPYGMIEWMRLAGSPNDTHMLSSLRIAVESACEEADGSLPNTPVALVLLTHSSCGAIAATVCGHKLPADDPAAALVPLLTPRFEQYRSLHTEPTTSDPYLIQAAEANALGLGREILTAESSDARILQSLMREGKAIIIPAVCLLHEGGRVQFMDPIGPNVE